MKTASTRQIIAFLQAYEMLHGVGSVASIGYIASGDRNIEYIFYVKDKHGRETKIEIPSIQEKDIWTEVE